jgi:hypothetical protein
VAGIVTKRSVLAIKVILTGEKTSSKTDYSNNRILPCSFPPITLLSTGCYACDASGGEFSISTFFIH